MKKILFPTEFSNHAGHIFRYALELANQFNAQLLCVHAYGRPEGYSIGDDEAKRERVLSKLENFAGEHTPDTHSNIRMKFIANLAYPADAILKIAEKENVDLIVLGMTGKTDDSTRYLGGNALKVIRAAECPVLAIPSSVNYEHVKKIVFTTDFEFEDLMVLNFISRAFDAEVHVLHVAEKKKQTPQAVKRMEALEEAYRNHGRLVFQILESDDVEKAIEEYVQREQADLLAMTTHKRSVIEQLLAGSTSRNIAKKTKTPLLVFKEI